MKNLECYGFIELSQADLFQIDGGDGFWSSVWSGIKSFFTGLIDGMKAVSLPM